MGGLLQCSGRTLTQEHPSVVFRFILMRTARLLHSTLPQLPTWFRFTRRKSGADWRSKCFMPSSSSINSEARPLCVESRLFMEDEMETAWWVVPLQRKVNFLVELLHRSAQIAPAWKCGRLVRVALGRQGTAVRGLRSPDRGTGHQSAVYRSLPRDSTKTMAESQTTYQVGWFNF